MQGELAQTEQTTTRTLGQPIQDPFLNALRRQRVPVSVYLTNGIKLQGIVAGFDSAVVLLKNNTKQMIFKHAVATIVPARNIAWHEQEDSAEGMDHPSLPDEHDTLEDY